MKKLYVKNLIDESHNRQWRPTSMGPTCDDYGACKIATCNIRGVNSKKNCERMPGAVKLPVSVFDFIFWSVCTQQ